jgi:gluconokinase
MPNLVVMGVAGAGKSTLASVLAINRSAHMIEGDAFHPQANHEKMARGEALSDQDRKPWLEALALELQVARQHKARVVMACSALKRSYRDILRAGDPDIVFVFIHGDLALLRQRLQQRKGHFVDERLLDSQLATLEPPTPDERFIDVDAHLPIDVAARTVTDNPLLSP